MKFGLVITTNQGSVSHLDFLTADLEKDTFKTAFEIGSKVDCRTRCR